MRNTILILCILALSGCTSQSKKQSDESEETAFVLDSTIRIGDAIEKALPSMKLSKVVDSIVYVPLETKIYLTNGLLQYVKPYWCAFPGRLFDAKGKYVKQIGKLGGGPGEDTSPWGYMTKNAAYSIHRETKSYNMTRTGSLQEQKRRYNIQAEA